MRINQILSAMMCENTECPKLARKYALKSRDGALCINGNLKLFIPTNNHKKFLHQQYNKKASIPMSPLK